MLTTSTDKKPSYVPIISDEYFKSVLAVYMYGLNAEVPKPGVLNSIVQNIKNTATLQSTTSL